MNSPRPERQSVLPDYRESRVLVVDDNRVNRHLLSALLERGGITSIAMAEDGLQALAQLGKFKPDLLLLDLMMPNLDGFEVCRRLRSDPAYRSLPILVQSSLNRAEDRARAFTAGATDYVSKPINAIELLSRVRIHLQNRMLLRSLQQYRERTERELMLARKMQERLMPPLPQLATLRAEFGLSLHAHFAPSSELGGDFWGMGRDDRGRLVIWLVDFSGHGVGAALNTFRLHAILNQLDLTGFNPAEFLALLNKRLCTLLPNGLYATMLAGVIDQQRDQFLYASASATQPLAWLPGSEGLRHGDNSGLPLGIVESASYENRVLELPRGARLFLYSDAAVELPVGDGVLDEAGLQELVTEVKDEPEGEQFLSRLLISLSARGSYDDDLTALVLTRDM